MAPGTAGRKRKAPSSTASSGRAKKNAKQQPKGKAGGKAGGKGFKGKAGSKKGKAESKRQEEEPEVEVGDEDVEFFEDNAAFSSFLVKMDAKALKKANKPKAPIQRPSAATNDNEADAADRDIPLEKLEARPRKAAWEKNKQVELTHKLPVKFMDGSVRPNKLLAETDAAKANAADDQQSGEDESDDDQDGDQDGDADELGSDVSDMEFEEIQDDNDAAKGESQAQAKPEPVAVTPVDLRQQRARRLAAKKVEIAQLCESILESPEDAFKRSKEHPDQLSKIQQLQSLCNDPDATVQKLSMLSQLSVFLDILPDYRIRVPTPGGDDQSGGKSRPQKKKVQQLQDYEASLLKNYQIFLKFCSGLVTSGIKGRRPDDESSSSPHGLRALSLAETGTKCLSELLQRKYAFNFHLNLVIALVPLADSAFPAIRSPACASFEAVFKADKTSASSLTIVQQMASYVKQKEHRVRPELLRTLLAMPLEVTMEQGEAARKRAKADRKKRRKQQSAGDTIAAGLKEAEAVVDRAERDKAQGDILHELVLIYFRILKQAAYSPSLPAVLEGLGKFAFLINLDILIDLLKVLKTMLRQDTLPLSAALQAVLTGLRTLQGPGQELLVDEKDFVDVLYRLLRQLASSSAADDRRCLPTALECVEAVLLRRKELVVDRVAAFAKRVLLVALDALPNEALALLALLRSLFHRYSKLQQLVESDVDRVATGEFRADVDDPDFANPFASAAWELSLLARHWHPAVAEFARGTAALAPSLPADRPAAMLSRYGNTGTFAFTPKVSPPPPNPLHRKLAPKKQGKRDRRRQNVVLVRDPYALDGDRQPSAFWRRCIETAEAEGGDELQLWTTGH